MRTLKVGLCSSLLPALLIAAGCQRAAVPGSTSADLELDDGTVRVTGPFVQDNLSVFLIHADNQDDRDFLTLPEGIEHGLVKVTEQDQEQVHALQVDNQSDRYLFLQEGDRVVGGKQDRIITASLVLPPKSGPTTVRTFCVEQGRWRENGHGRGFGNAATASLAPKAVRGNAKIEADQGTVWHVVEGQKLLAEKKLDARNATTSINPTLDSPQAKKEVTGYAAKLNTVADEQADAIGVAFVVNGKVEEINVYPNHALFRRQYPRLLEAYALHATMLKGETKEVRSWSSAEIVAFMQEGNVKSRREDKLSADNETVVSELDNNRYRCATKYAGKRVHWQLMVKTKPAYEKEKAKGGEVMGNDWVY